MCLGYKRKKRLSMFLVIIFFYIFNQFYCSILVLRDSIVDTKTYRFF